MKAPRTHKLRPAPAPDRFHKAYTYWWIYRTTAFGRVALLGLVITGALGSASVEMPLFRFFCVLFFLLSFALPVGLIFRPWLRASVALPQQVVAGKPVQVEVLLHNDTRRAAREVGAAFFEVDPAIQHLPAPVLKFLPPGGSGKVLAAFHPLRRGAYLLSLRVYSAWPLHLYRFPCMRSQRQPLLVLPAFHPLPSLDLPVEVRYQPGGIALSSNVGESPEYIGNREYRHGDSLRRIDFRAWARLAKPAVREYMEEYYVRIALVLDTQVHPHQGALARVKKFNEAHGDPCFEAAVSLCASVADLLSRGEYLLDLFAAGPELYVFRAGRHTAHLENVLEILACVQESKSNPFETLTPAIVDELGNTAAVICIFLQWDESREQMLREARDNGCAIKAILVGDPARWKDAQSSVAELTLLSPEDINSGTLEAV